MTSSVGTRISEKHVVQALGVGLFADALGDLLLEVRIGVDDVPLVVGIGRLGGSCVAHIGYSALASFSRRVTTACSTASTPKKNSAVITTMIPTITEVIQVSFQLVQVTLRASARTSRRNWIGLNGFFGACRCATRALARCRGGRRGARRSGTMPDDPSPSRSFELFFHLRGAPRLQSDLGRYSGRSGGTRTHDPRFWRPMLYQLSYTPSHRRPQSLDAAPKRPTRRRARGPSARSELIAAGSVVYQAAPRSSSEAPPN